MHCHICDKELSDKEVSWNKDLDSFEPCTTCLDIAMDAAYCDGYETEDDSFVVLASSFDDEYVPTPYGAKGYNDDWSD